MSHTNSTANLGLPQFIGTDKPTWLSDVNGAFAAIDSYAGSNDAALAIVDGKADTAIGDASSAVTTATNAATTAGNAAATATNANTIAGNALTVANGINSKVGVLTDLHTTDKSTVVAAINEVFDAQTAPTAAEVSYDNTVSGLAAADVQAAIDELAQGGGAGAWSLIGSETGTTPIDISGSTADEFFITVVYSGDHAFNQVIPAVVLSGTSQNFEGGYAHSGSTAMIVVQATNAAVTLSNAYINGTDQKASCTISVYGR